MTAAPEPLSRLLRRADPAAESPAPLAPAAFVASVHARLRDEPAAPSLWHRIFARQALPLAAAFTILAALAVGSTVAYARAQRARTEVLASAYARSIDPWQLHGATVALASSVSAAPAHHHP